MMDVSYIMREANTFGEPNWNHIYASDVLQGIAKGLSNLNNQPPDLTQPLPYTSNTSKQAMYGSFAEGGEVDQNMEDWFWKSRMPQSAPPTQIRDTTISSIKEAAPSIEPDDGQTFLSMDFSRRTRKDMSELPQSKGIDLTDIDPNVSAATNELLERFPDLRITSGRRSWGDKDAHPLGRAIDASGPSKAEAWKYYSEQLVPKYGLNKALPLNHGTGPHIHVGYYEEGGEMDPGKPPFNMDSVYNANRKIPFMDRLINADKYPIRPNPDGTYSTHLMGSASDENGAFAFPSLRLVNGKFVSATPREAALAGDIIRFKSDSDAEYFATHYKESSYFKKRKYSKGGTMDFRKGGKMCYDEGGEYDLSPEEIQELIKQGYKLEY